MLFFTLLFVITGMTVVGARLGVPGLDDRRTRMRFAMGPTFLFTGTDHLLNPDRYLPMVPESLPCRGSIVLVSGLCEITGGMGLMSRKWQRPAGIMLAVYLICETPANVKVAADGLEAKGMPKARWIYAIRLCLVPVAIWWALYSGGAVQRPRFGPM